jgi:hypothetical protein
MAYQKLQTSNDDWTDKQFVVDPNLVVSGEPFDLAISDTINNNSGAENIDVVVKFPAINPGQAVNGTSISYFLQVFVEEEIAPGEWDAIAESFGQRYGDLTNGPEEAKFIIQTKNTTDQGQPFTTANGFRWYVNENPSESLRVRISATETNPSGPAKLVSIDLSGSYRIY